MVTNGPHSACNLQQQGTFMRLNYVQDCKGLWGAGRKVGFEHFAARTRESRCKRPLNILEPSYRMPRWLAVMGVSMPRLQTAWSCKLRYMISQLKSCSGHAPDREKRHALRACARFPPPPHHKNTLRRVASPPSSTWAHEKRGKNRLPTALHSRRPMCAVVCGGRQGQRGDWS